MRPHIIFALAITLPIGCLSQQPSKPPSKQAPAEKSEVQLLAETLLDRAYRLSDIRSPNAPAFRLQINFSVPGPKLDTVQGTYTETWVSNSQWRREIVVGDAHRLEVGGPNKISQTDTATVLPEVATKIPALAQIFPAPSLALNFDSVKEGSIENSTQDCAITKPGDRGETYAFCFDKKSGALVQSVSPEIRPKNATSFTCLYGIFRKFGNLLYPREIACFEDQHRRLEAKVEELSLDPSPEAALFKPPPDAVERDECSGKAVPPSVLGKTAPMYPASHRDQDSSVTLSLVIATDGKPKDIQVVRSGGPGFDESATQAVSNWRFWPGTCDGQPMAAELPITVNFAHGSDVYVCCPTPHRPH